MEPIFSPGTPKIIQLLIRYSAGIIKSEKQATYIVIGLIILMLAVSFFLFFSGDTGKKERERFAPAADAPANEVAPPVKF